MTRHPTPTAPDQLRCRLDTIDGALEQKVRTCEASVAELRRRGGGGSTDARRYALGSTLAIVGVGDVPDTVLLGLLAHPATLLGRMEQVIASNQAGKDAMFGDLVRAVLTDKATFAWCERWGRILQWRHRKALYDAAVQSFIDSGRAGPREPWRRKDPTDDQAALIATLAAILDEAVPTLAIRGEAFDWIRERGGNPAYWREPAPLPCARRSMMSDEQDLDAMLAAFEDRRLALDRAIAACAAEQALGRTGYAAFIEAKEQRDRLMAMIAVLQQRLGKALEDL